MIGGEAHKFFKNELTIKKNVLPKNDSTRLITNWGDTFLSAPGKGNNIIIIKRTKLVPAGFSARGDRMSGAMRRTVLQIGK